MSLIKEFLCFKFADILRQYFTLSIQNNKSGEGADIKSSDIFFCFILIEHIHFEANKIGIVEVADSGIGKHLFHHLFAVATGALVRHKENGFLRFCRGDEGVFKAHGLKVDSLGIESGKAYYKGCEEGNNALHRFKGITCEVIG